VRMLTPVVAVTRSSTFDKWNDWSVLTRFKRHKL
jgi:hypothetical protein